MRRFHFYHRESGLLHNSQFTVDSPGAEECAARCAPADHIAIEGSFDHLSQRVDIQSGQVVGYQPPKPTPDHEWHIASRRWVLSAAAQEREAQRVAASTRIAALELAQAGPLRKLQLDPVNSAARRRLEVIDQEIADLEKQL